MPIQITINITEASDGFIDLTANAVAVASIIGGSIDPTPEEVATGETFRTLFDAISKALSTGKPIVFSIRESDAKAASFAPPTGVGRN